MKKTRLAAIVAAAALIGLLTGCAGTDESQTVLEGSQSAPSPVEAQPAETPAPPLVAETPETETPASPETNYLEKVRAALDEESQIPEATDAQLIAAGQEACRQFAEGKSVEAIRVIEGEKPDGLGWYGDSSKIASIAQQFLCD